MLTRRGIIGGLGVVLAAPAVVEASSLMRPVTGVVYVGIDFERSPAAIFMRAVGNRVFVQHELLGYNEGAVTFAPKVKRFLAEKYPGFEVRLFGDPKGCDGGATDDRTAYDVFEAEGLRVTPWNDGTSPFFG
jgi:hypothetical protein